MSKPKLTIAKFNKQGQVVYYLYDKKGKRYKLYHDFHYSDLGLYKVDPELHERLKFEFGIINEIIDNEPGER